VITPDLRDQLTSLAEEAGDAIMRVYRSQDFDVVTKSDDSPLTRADTVSQRVLAVLDGDLGLPLLSEEGRIPSYQERKAWSAHWLVDPLDGTKEFIHRNGEFTVNIALIQDHRPVFGVVHVPVTGVTYVGGKDHPSVRIDGKGEQPIHVSSPHDGPIHVVASHSHMDPATVAYIDALGSHATVAAGSSLKFCLVAEGSADVYPRFGPTMEWDTAAGQAVVEGAGGLVLSDGRPLQYNREDLLNPPFLVAAPWLLERHPERMVGSAA